MRGEYADVNGNIDKARASIYDKNFVLRTYGVSGGSVSALVGGTQYNFPRIFLNANSSWTFPMHIGIEDDGAASPGGIAGGVSKTIPIDRDAMRDAGGSCAVIANQGMAPVNTPPVADAGADQTVDRNAVSFVTLDGSGSSDADNDTLTFTWSQTSGPTSTVRSVDSTGAILDINPPTQDGTQVWSLSVFDGKVSQSDQVEINWTSSAVNRPPEISTSADSYVYFDPSNTSTPATAQLVADFSDPDGDPVNVSWRQVSGPATVFSIKRSEPGRLTQTVIQPSTPGVSVYEASVSDGNGGLALSRVQVIWRQNAPPAGDPPADQSPSAPVTPGQTITLSAGSVSDPDGQTLSYSWTQTGGPAVSLNNPSSATPSFSAPNSGGTLTFSVVISDGISSVTKTVTVTLTIDAAPTADAGPNQTLANVAPGTLVTLDGTGSSDPEGGALKYTWRQISGPVVTLQNANTATPSFTYPPENTNVARARSVPIVGSPVENLVFGLIVSDGAQDSAESTVQITINTNLTPEANAGVDQTVIGLTNGDTVILDGSASSDPDGDALTYAWSVVSGAATIQDPTAVKPTLVYQGSNTDGTDEVVEVELVVSDGAASSKADTVSITFQDNRAPVADAGSDLSGINAGDVVTLNGGGSSDPDGDALTYQWTQVSGPQVTLSDATSVSPSFTAPDVTSESTLTFQLVVSDGSDQSPPATVSVAVRPVGTITIVSLATGGDTNFTYNSALAALNGTVTTTNGRASLSADRVVTGQYAVTMQDARDVGFALTSLSCNDTDSAVDLSLRKAVINIAPGEDVVCTFSTVNSRGAAQKAIKQMQAQRGALILSNGPNKGRRIDRVSGAETKNEGVKVAGLQLMNGNLAPVSLSLAEGESKAAFSLSGLNGGQSKTGKGSFDVWGELTYTQFDNAGKDGDFSLFYVGADYLLTDKMLIGVLAQFDKFDTESLTRVGDGEGTGFMVGPYITARLTDRLYADARIAWGQSDNSITPLGSYTDDFETDRVLFAGSLTGDFNVGKTLKIRPTLEYRTFNETQKAYTDSLGVLIPESELNLNELSFAPKLEKSYLEDDGDRWLTFIEAEGIYNFGDEVIGVFNKDFRLRFEGGASWTSESGMRAGVSAFVDGIGASDFEAHGLRVTVSKELK